MDRLWAPWRMEYVSEVDSCKDCCVFCTLPKSEKGKKNLILYKGEFCFVIMNRYPYSNGHLMVVPYRHTSDISSINQEESSELFRLLKLSIDVLKNRFCPDGFNTGINLGRTAGAGIDQHIHMHIVPRWNGDTNFMPVIGKTKVIPQSLEDTYEALMSGFEKIQEDTE